MNKKEFYKSVEDHIKYEDNFLKNYTSPFVFNFNIFSIFQPVTSTYMQKHPTYSRTDISDAMKSKIALASDFKRVGDDMRKVMPYFKK